MPAISAGASADGLSLKRDMRRRVAVTLLFRGYDLPARAGIEGEGLDRLAVDTLPLESFAVSAPGRPSPLCFLAGHHCLSPMRPVTGVLRDFGT